MSFDPKIAVVVPTYQHSGLVSEAIRTALAQVGGPEYVIVAVDDGCPSRETRVALSGWSRLHPEKVHYLHQANRGLSGARNAGIAYARGHWPGLDAIYLLDSDNRLEPHAMQLFGHLLENDPDADWFFPNFDMFGLESTAHNGGPYSVARMANSNQCEAGSLVRSRVFDAGIWFDETMRSGYEDWDFWLTATGAGFRGRRVDQSFFRYRKRPESMLAGSHTDDTTLRERIAEKHRWLYARDGVAQAVMAEGPVALVIDLQSGTGSLRHGPRLLAEEMDFPALAAYLFRAVAQPQRHTLPPYVLLARGGAEQVLDDPLRGQSWLTHLAQGLVYNTTATLRIAPEVEEGSYWFTTEYHSAPQPFPNFPRTPGGRKLRDKLVERAETRFGEADIVGLRTRAMVHMLDARDVGQAFRELTDRSRPPECMAYLPEWQLPEGTPGLLPLWRKFTDRLLNCRFANDHRHKFRTWRADPAVTGPSDLPAVLSKNALDGAPLFIERKGGEKHIGFVLPILKFGGVEKCAIALARAMRAEGIVPHLFIYGNQDAANTEWLYEPFESVHMVGNGALRDWRGPRYLGTKMAPEPPKPVLASILGPLSGMDAVINAGSAALHHGLGPLKRKGIVTVAWEHLIETGPYGRSYGTPYLAIAYEGGYDLILTCSRQLATWMRGQGVPGQKLLPIPNGPGFPMSPERVAETLAERANRDADAPVRVGFLGRMDRQKGLDRFVRIVEACRDLPLEFSITGKAVLDGAEMPVIPPDLPVYPAAYELGDVEAAFARMDILLMPSRDEGLPLTIMEAQRVGVVPIVSNVGAVPEAIRNGETGYIVAADHVVDETVSRLRQLCADRAELARVSRAASADADNWTVNAKAVIAALQARWRA
ncbi:glycosyltransferase [Algicella marina]|uniref:Glycosyltransferase n=1 Tax=Algicella marina TaxID=2683284 RepID=A0A6P1T3P0_9RHOB|nr:glycosyltransferase [Algicella marina]QHQ36627.1 glycosyltransferase [Algicella marina]